jgi:hypothetical protein
MTPVYRDPNPAESSRAAEEIVRRADERTQASIKILNAAAGLPPRSWILDHPKFDFIIAICMTFIAVVFLILTIRISIQLSDVKNENRELREQITQLRYERYFLTKVQCQHGTTKSKEGFSEKQ